MKAGYVRKIIGGALASSLVFLTACAANAPQDALKPEGPVAREQHNLFLPVFWIAAAIFVLVEGLIIFAAFKFRDRPGRGEPRQVHGNTRLEFTWTLIPALILVGVAIPTVLTVFRLDAAAEPGDLKVKVVGHQWWWEYRYDTDPEIVAANELVIPTGRTVFLELESADVIHSFWVPKLAGKQDVVPGRTNTLHFLAEEPGTYFGQCAEFCAISHANMRLRVIAKTPTDYDAWVRNQQRPAREPSSADAVEGKQIFLSNACIQCHAIAGTDAAGVLGPNLTHFGSQATFGAAMFDMDDEALFLWIKHARDQKPGVIMPNFDRPLPEGESIPGFKQLTDDQIRKVVAYLRSLL